SRLHTHGEWRKHWKYARLPEEVKQEQRAITDERRAIFLKHLESFGERSIHPLQSLSGYLKKNCASRLSFNERREHVEHWRYLLDKYERYEVRLTEAEPEIEMEIKNSVAAVLRGAKRVWFGQEKPPATQTLTYGSRFIYWYDLLSILAFFLEFE